MTEKKHILFVDDEPNILSSLRRMLFSMGSEWEIAFANSGEEALRKLAVETFDVIVSDLSMPEMNGFQLLTKVKKRYPQITRIAFSAQTDVGKNLHSLKPIHQYISKPINTVEIINTIKRTCSLHDMLHNKKLRELVSNMESLPSFPVIYERLITELESPNASLNNISTIVAEDQGMSVKILQFVNSAFFGLPRQISNQKMAVVLLGLDIITSLALSIRVFQQLQHDKMTRFNLDNLWAHCKRVSVIAKTIAKNECNDKNLIEGAFTSGLLHDIGKLILTDNMPEQYSKALAIASRERIPMFEAEQDVFGTTHAEVGAFLLGIWGLNESIVEAVAYHHQPQKCHNSSFSSLTVVYMADIFDHIKSVEIEKVLIDRCDENYVNELGLIDRLPLWVDACLSITNERNRKNYE
ncbi:MAG: response regulator [Candidatus Hatepunaea meridiana]|nr:response regulator [Candidatus Hatepunaea meridiana]